MKRRSCVGFSFTQCGQLLFCALLTLSALSIQTFAQEVAPDDQAPPPLRRMSEEEKTKLAAETEVKRRTKLTLELMEARLARSESLVTQEEYDQMFLELGGFHALMDSMLDFLDNKNKGSGKVINNYKRFEIGLRGFTPRLEVIRREIPGRYEVYLRNLIKNLRAARAKAIEPLFDDTVVPTRNDS